jgi:hypothetical protein
MRKRRFEVRKIATEPAGPYGVKRQIDFRCRRLRWHLRGGLFFLALIGAASAISAQTISVQYLVNVTERAPLVQDLSAPIDHRIGLKRGLAEPFQATFLLTMTFDVLVGSGSGVGFGVADSGFFTYYGQPSFSAIPVPKAAPLLSPGDAGAVSNVFGQTFEQQAFDSRSGLSYTNWGAYLNDVLLIPSSVESGSTILLTHIRPANLTGPDEFQLVSLDTYLNDIKADLDFDFVTWSLFRTTDVFTSDSYDYRGTAHFVSSIQDLISALVADVVSLNLKAGISKSFDAKLSVVLEALDDHREHNDVAAVNGLYSFINAVEAQRGKELTESQADSLISAATAIIAALGG